MRYRFLASQFINLIGLIVIIVNAVMRSGQPAAVFKVGMAMGTGLFFLGLALIMIFGRQYHLHVKKNACTISSSSSALQKFILPNFAIALFLVILVLSFYDRDGWRFLLFFTLVSAYPIYLLSTSGMVFRNTNVLLLDRFNLNFQTVPKKSIVSFQRHFFGFAYKLKYRDDMGTVRYMPFFPKGSFLRSKPTGILELQKWIELSESASVDPMPSTPQNDPSILR